MQYGKELKKGRKKKPEINALDKYTSVSRTYSILHTHTEYYTHNYNGRARKTLALAKKKFMWLAYM